MASLLPFFESIKKSGQILLGKNAHIDVDLKRSLSDTLAFKVNRDGKDSTSAGDLKDDFMKLGKYFSEITAAASREMGIPSLFRELGSAIADIPSQRTARFEEWMEEHS